MHSKGQFWTIPGRDSVMHYTVALEICCLACGNLAFDQTSLCRWYHDCLRLGLNSTPLSGRCVGCGVSSSLYVLRHPVGRCATSALNVLHESRMDTDDFRRAALRFTVLRNAARFPEKGVGWILSPERLPFRQPGSLAVTRGY